MEKEQISLFDREISPLIVPGKSGGHPDWTLERALLVLTPEGIRLRSRDR